MSLKFYILGDGDHFRQVRYFTGNIHRRLQLQGYFDLCRDYSEDPSPKAKLPSDQNVSFLHPRSFQVPLAMHMLCFEASS